MRNVIAFSFSLSAVLCASIALADSASPRIVYCPTEVVCDADGPASSCRFEQHDREYWNEPLPSHYPPSVLAGQYKVSYVSAPYHSRGAGYAICVYTHVDEYRTLSLRAKPESNLERYDAADSAWWQAESWWECRPDATTDCPLIEEDALFVANKRQYSLLLEPTRVTIKPGEYTRVYMEDFTECADYAACLLELYSTEAQIGAITLDHHDHLKIVDIFDNIDVKSEIVKMGEYNGVEVR